MDKPSQQDIESLVKLFGESDWTEMHIKTDTLEFFISENPGSGLQNSSIQPNVVNSQIEDIKASPVVSEKPEAKPVAKYEVPKGMLAVRAPNLGTFYRRPKPDSDPYIEVGDKVTESTEVCLIEVMKLFTPVKAESLGEIIEILVSDGEMVEFNQPLILIKPS